jgi:cytochrome c553
MFDIGGILLLILLIAVFGFLVTRAWKIKIALLKWVGVILAGLLTIIPTVLLALALIGFAKLNQHYDNPVSKIWVAGTAAQIARGEKLAHACASCHSPGNELPLSGSNFMVKFEMPPLGTFYAPNLTPSGDIADWSDGEVIRAIREGVHKNGRSLLIMPSNDFRNMSDEDVQALVATYAPSPPPAAQHPTTSSACWGRFSRTYRTSAPPSSPWAA